MQPIKRLDLADGGTLDLGDDISDARLNLRLPLRLNGSHQEHATASVMVVGQDGAAPLTAVRTPFAAPQAKADGHGTSRELLGRGV